MLLSDAVPYVPVILGFGMLCLVVWAKKMQSRQSAANLQRLAQKLGLEFRQQKFGMFETMGAATGKLGGREVGFHQFTTGSGRSEAKWRAISVFPSNTGMLTFDVRVRGLFSKLEGLFGAKETTVGDEAFDKACILHTNEPEFLRAALIPEIRSRITSSLKAGGLAATIRLDKGNVRYAERGDFASLEGCDRLERMLPLLHDLAALAEVAAEALPARGK